MYNYQVLESGHVFRFRRLCPYCKADLTYTVTGWEMDETGLWLADLIESQCSEEPDLEVNQDDWVLWLNSHYNMPYLYQMPVDEKVKAWINSKYRFYFHKPI